MFNINDSIKKFTGLGGNDGLALWYGKQDRQCLNDVERGWLQQRPYDVSGTNQDMWFNFLRSDGYTGTLNDMLAAYWAAPSRVIPTLAGSQYGTLDTAIVAAAGDTIEIEFAITAAGTVHFLCDGDIATNRAYVYFKADDTISWDVPEITALTLDGVAATVNVTATPNDGKVHTIIATLATGATLSVIGADYNTNQDYQGQILSIKFTDKSGASDVVTNYVFDSGSDTEQYARGSTTDKITLFNFATTDWNRYTLQQNILHDAGVIGEAWVGDNLVVNGRFDADLSDWAVDNPSAQTVEWVDGELHISGDGISLYGAVQSILLAAQPMLIKLDYRLITGQQRIQHGGASFTTLSETKQYSTLVTPSSAYFALYRQAGIAGEGYFDNVKAQHLLEVA